MFLLEISKEFLRKLKYEALANPELEKRGCTCFLGHPPCSYCTDCIKEDQVEI